MRNSFRYTNPVTRGLDLAMRDHQILKVDGLWYMTGTSLPVWTGPNPGVRLLVSEDLLNWRHHCWLIDSSNLPQDCSYNGRFWAPEIHRAEGRFWLTVNCGHEGPESGERRMDDHRIWLFSADAVDGTYLLMTPQGLGKGFKNDANLFTDDDGCSYLYCSGGGLWQSEMDLARGRLIGGDDFQKICSPRDDGIPDWMIGGIEGPFVIKRDNFYWMFFSAWTRGYETGVMRSPSPLGPWELWPKEPIFGVRKRRYREEQMREGGYGHLLFEDTPDPFVEVGHCAVFEGPDGRDWLSCHYFLEGRQIVSTDPVLEYADTAPQLGIEPLRFEKGFFTVNGPTWTEQASDI